MTEGNCAICLNKLDKEEADILTMGSFGVPRYLCKECASELSAATSSKDYNEIEAAMDRIGEKLAYCGIEDSKTLDTVEEIFASAKKRAVEIKNGTYDFALDEAEDEGVLDDIPEELLETEEDRLLDEREAESMKKFDSVMNWVILALGAAACIFLVIYFFFL